MDDASETEEQGIACALGKICLLESRLRDAIQSTHTLNRSFGTNWDSTDRERIALLEIREHMEGLEDKLRGYKSALSDSSMSDERAIALSQMDSCRKALLKEARDKIDRSIVLFNKDVVRDILAFADTRTGDEVLPDVSFDLHHDSSSPRSSQGTDASALTGDFSEAGSCWATSNSASPTHTSRKDLDTRLSFGEGQENHYPYPHPFSASTPNFRRSQGIEHPFQDLGGARSHSFSEPSRRGHLWQYDLGSEMVAASHASQREFGGLPARPSRTGWSEESSFLSGCTGPRGPGVPPSYQDSCDPLISAVPGSAPNDSADDMPYGGKLSFKARTADLSKQPTMPVSPVPKSEPPRVLNDPTYSEGSSRTDKMSSDDEKVSGLLEAVSAIQPNRMALERRAALNNSQATAVRGGLSLRQLLAGMFSFVMWPMHLSESFDWYPAAKLVTACLTGGASALILKQAVCKEGRFRFLPRTVHRPQRKPRRKQMRLPADGALVPGWMHRTRFKVSDTPPLGALTPTASPPQGEMFPSIPPPSSSAIKG